MWTWIVWHTQKQFPCLAVLLSLWKPVPEWATEYALTFGKQWEIKVGSLFHFLVFMSIGCAMVPYTASRNGGGLGLPPPPALLAFVLFSQWSFSAPSDILTPSLLIHGFVAVCPRTKCSVVYVAFSHCLGGQRWKEGGRQWWRNVKIYFSLLDMEHTILATSQVMTTHSPSLRLSPAP